MGRARPPGAPPGGEGSLSVFPSLSRMPTRRTLPHELPSWVGDDAVYFLTICTSPRGLNQLCHREVAFLLRESVAHREDLGRWWVPLLLLMPDHLHMLVRPDPSSDLAATVSAWKRYAALHAGIRWQRDFFEHRIRQDESLDEKAEYILQNPVRAGLIAQPDAWPYAWQNW